MHRYRSEARLQAGRTGSSSILPQYTTPKSRDTQNETGGLNGQDAGRGLPSGSTTSKQANGDDGGYGGARDPGGHAETANANGAEDAISKSAPPPAPPPDTTAPESQSATITSTDGADDATKKPKLSQRMSAGSKRFVRHTRNAIFRSWVNVLLLFVPIGIIMEALQLNDALIFAMNAVAIVPLAGLLSHATESVAARMGDTLGALLNVSFGNAVELIIFIIALVKGEIRIVQASLLGSILANLLLILGMAFLFGGLRYREQIYNSTVTQMSACLLSLSVMSLLLPTAFHASFNDANSAAADKAVLRVSRGTSVILLIVYVLYLLFQLKSHAYMYESTPQNIIDEESHPGVLADIMNSSSSSDDSSSSDSSDSDTSGSGSIITTGKKIRNKMFKNRRRRKSSASTSSTTPSSAVPSALSSPSMERQNSYWEAHAANQQASRHEPALGVIASGDEGDAEQEEGRHNIAPRFRDFAEHTEPAVTEDAKSPERKRFKRKHKRHHHKKRKSHHDEEKEAMEQQEKEAEVQQQQAKLQQPQSEPKVGWADDLEYVQTPEAIPEGQVDQSPGKLAFNMRQLSSKVGRPALPKYLSNTVFTTPAPQPEPIKRPVQPALARARSEGSKLRRTSSLPDRLNQQQKQASSSSAPTPAFNRSDPLPPFQHQRIPIRKVQSENEDPDEEPVEEYNMSRTAAVVLLLFSTALVAVCAEFMVDAIPGMLDNSPVISEAFIGLIILPIVGNAAEHVTAVTVATKNKMDLAIGVAVGSSIQIALFVTPVVVLLGWILHTDMSLYFNLFETVSLFVTAFVVNFLVLDGRSNYLEGSLLIAAYIIIAVGAFFYPSAKIQSALGGGES